MRENLAKRIRLLLILFMMTGLGLAAEIIFRDGSKAEGDFKDGKKVGVWSYFNACGEKVRQETYQDDILDGPAYQWDDDGFLLSEANWKMGKRHGRSVQYWVTGAVRSEGLFHEGSGKLTNFSKNGIKVSESEFKNGEGCQVITWSASGQKSSEYKMNEAGRYDGSYTYYQQDGAKKSEIEYRDGTIVKIIDFVISSPWNWAVENGRIVSVWEPVLKDGKVANLPFSGFPFELTVDPIHNRIWHLQPSAGNEPCTYLEIPGSAMITAIKSARAGSNNCPRNPVVVIFDFTADDPQRSSKCMRDHYLTVGAGMNPSSDLVEKKGLKVGQTLRCIRKKIITGACSPFGFEFPELDLSDYAKWCF